MALIDEIKAIADAIRSKTGYTEPMSLDEMPDMIEQIEGGSGTIHATDDGAGNVVLTVAGFRVLDDESGNITIR